MIGVLERMIGPFDGNEFNDVVFREPFGNLDGDHFVLCSVDDNHVIGIVEIFLLQYIEIPERVEKMLVDFHLPIEPYLDFLSLAELALVGFGNKIAHGLIHIDGRAAQGYFFKRISPFNQVAERDVATETGGVDVKRFCL